MPSLSIDSPQHRSPTSPLPPITPHGNISPHPHRLNRYRRPHHLRLSSPPKSPLLFSISSTSNNPSYHPLQQHHQHHHHQHQHHNHHQINDPKQQLLTPEIVYSQQNQSSPWKGIFPPSTAATTPAIIPTTAAGSLQRADSIMSNSKVSYFDTSSSHHGHTSTTSIASNGSSGIGGSGTLPFSFSQQNLLQRLHQEKLLQQQQQQQTQKNLQNNKKLLFSQSRNDEAAILSAAQFYPEEISLMKMDEDFAQFNTEIDFTQPDPSRPLQIRVSGRSIYVDPQFAQDLSPIFTNFLARELVAGKRRCVEMQREDISFLEVLEMAKVLCPYELGMFPKPVEATTFCSLSRLATKFKVTKLKLACELFIARMNLDDPHISSEMLCAFFVSSYRDGLTQATKIRLLEAIICRGISAVDRRTCDIPALCELIREASIKYRANELMHSDLINDARLRVPCRTCRIEQPNVPLPAIKGELSNTGIPAFVVCSKCKSTICCGCILKPCKKAIEDFVVKFTERYNSN
uniref:BTB domain-containing protein n=1 Tax=Panagrolaimus sp. PS1159 TaxID=55785 RepID=A0AC35GVD6_9BILA